MYSGTCMKRPLGQIKCGPYTKVVFICRFNNMESMLLGLVKGGLYKQVFFIYRWSLEQVLLYMHVENIEKTQ